MIKPTIDSFDSGTVGIFTGSKYVIVFPGFTGDALSHSNFIEAAQKANLGVICVTPKWTNSIDDVLLNNDELLEEFKSKKIDFQTIKYVRAVSFGAQLSIPWIKQFRNSIEKVVMITPCSASQLPSAGTQIKIKVIPSTKQIDKVILNVPLKIICLEKDSIVPSVDNSFKEISSLLESQKINYSNHFMAGETPECSTKVAEWFVGKA